MAKVTYQVVEHDGAWAYKVGAVFSEPFTSRDDALRAARRAAGEQRASGDTTPIEYEDAQGKWHEEVAEGSDRPATEVSDT